MIGIQSTSLGDESARWFMRDTGTVHLLSVRCGAKVTTLPSQPQLEEYRELSAPLRAEIRRRVDNAVRPAHTTPAS